MMIDFKSKIENVENIINLLTGDNNENTTIDKCKKLIIEHLEPMCISLSKIVLSGAPILGTTGIVKLLKSLSIKMSQNRDIRTNKHKEEIIQYIIKEFLPKIESLIKRLSIFPIYAISSNNDNVYIQSGVSAIWSSVSPFPIIFENSENSEIACFSLLNISILILAIDCKFFRHKETEEGLLKATAQVDLIMPNSNEEVKK